MSCKSADIFVKEVYIMKNKFLQKVQGFQHQDIVNYFYKITSLLPDYFWTIPASSTGKYHPKVSQQPGGLVNHTLLAHTILKRILEIDYYRQQFTSRERELLEVAILLHDGLKKGIPEGKYTVHEHPTLMANLIRNTEGLPPQDIVFLADAIESHMGQFTTAKYSPYVLPLPQTPAQRLIHLADYLSASQDLEQCYNYALNPLKLV